MKMIKEHTVTFFSPGTFVAETRTREIPEWSPAIAARMAKEVVERHGARPYGFQFDTYERPAPIEGHKFERKHVAKSGMFYINGTVETLAQVKARATERDRILVSNMEGNGYDRIVTTRNGYSWSQHLADGDTVVNDHGEVIYPTE